ncbi:MULTISPECIES: ornithine cyclodeaminase family protein [Streptomyces]|uniref:Ornithine cyclodeaminase family protein n=1 Tax=Streptomyces doudnae TaxID=3075536 RepID=A0ABD5EXS3_9ACTN|nr:MULTISPECIES: ornithine cyclodeaminase family protein [unclassified Streptomyces]MDT0439159.1 ornithine cyclodeaminase family protein [Streptomyces sp. DSM 41981]MYQ63733.1 ornithine cyclodeaminase family protein [Streptomyces sp. SID4950]SCD64302.1 ornithine cyclodeaminase [Streptomyces sp. SolWspMP-5a-2]
MSGLLVLDRAATLAALDPGRLMDAVARALVAVADGTASAPPRIAALAPNGLLGAMPGHVPGLGLAAKLVSVFADPGRPGRSSHRGVIALFDADDGRPLAVLDAEPVTAWRTAAVATHSALALAGPGPVVVVGTGAQARAQVGLLAALRPADPVTVAGRDPAGVRATAALHPAGIAADGIEAAVRGAATVYCCTGATTPVLHRDWLAPGTHVSSVGGSHGPELDAATVRDAALFAEWPGASATPPPSGAHELQGLPADRTVTLLGSVLAGAAPGGHSPGALTVFKSTGHAALDVAAAHVVHATATGRFRRGG